MAALVVAVLAPLPATVAAAGPTCSLEGEELRCSDGRRFPVYASGWADTRPPRA